MGLTKLERETGILWNDEEKQAAVWSTSPHWIGRFRKQFGPGVPLGTHCVQWLVDRSSLTVRKRQRRVASEAQLANLKARRKGVIKLQSHLGGGTDERND